MGVSVKEVQPEVQLPVEEVIFTSSLGTRVLRFRQDSKGAKRSTVVFQRFASKRAFEIGAAPLSEVKSSVFPKDLRELSQALTRLADSIDAG